MNFLDFLREVGKFMTVNVMMSKDTVKKRIEDPKQSISYTEFSYQLLQGYDACRLFKDSNVILQIGGQDQWGNLVTGTELIRKKYEADSYALTWPLITDSTGKKFGKSEGNAMFLDTSKTSPYFIYQYFMNTPDEDISRFLKMLTLIETEEIDEIVEKHLESPELRE
jgi:tyrosyl-tRNA synthetase